MSSSFKYGTGGGGGGGRHSLESLLSLFFMVQII